MATPESTSPPSSKPRFPNRSLLLFIAGFVLAAITRLDPFYEWFYTWLGGRLQRFARTEDDREAASVWARDAYAVALFILSVAAWLAVGLNRSLDFAIVVFATWRVSQLVAYKLKIVLVDINQPGHYIASVSRSIMQGILSVAEVMILFAALDHALAPSGFIDTSQQPVAVPKTAGGWLYVSWTSLLTLGSTYSPRGGTAKFLLMTEVAAGLILIAVSLGSFVGAVRLKPWSKEPPKE
jgi:hypothetical protein